MEQTGYHVVLEPDPNGGYVAVVPAFPGCYSQGETAEATWDSSKSSGAAPVDLDELSSDEEPLAWESEGWEQFGAPR